MRVLINMNDREHLGNKTFGYEVHIDKNDDLGNPIKRVYFLEGKYFTVIDKSITEKLRFSDIENKELYFQQELTDDECIILRRFKMSE